jgi:hypothetical protein
VPSGKSQARATGSSLKRPSTGCSERRRDVHCCVFAGYG